MPESCFYADIVFFKYSPPFGSGFSLSQGDSRQKPDHPNKVDHSALMNL